MSEARVIYSDAVCGLKELADESIDCCVTSPPYYGLRDYGHDGQIGLETSVYEYIERLLAVFREVRRVMKPDGTLWVNIKDSYAGSGKGAANYPDNAKKYKQGSSRGLLGAAKAGAVKPHDLGIKPKDLMGIPFILALALRADGWYWRQVILWEKPNAMPESANDRCTDAHEYVLLFAKSKRYYFDYEAIMEPAVGFDRTPPAGGRGTLRPNSRRRKGNAKSFRGGGAYTANQSHDNNTDAETAAETERVVDCYTRVSERKRKPLRNISDKTRRKLHPRRMSRGRDGSRPVYWERNGCGGRIKSRTKLCRSRNQSGIQSSH